MNPHTKPKLTINIEDTPKSNIFDDISADELTFMDNDEIDALWTQYCNDDDDGTRFIINRNSSGQTKIIALSPVSTQSPLVQDNDIQMLDTTNIKTSSFDDLHLDCVHMEVTLLTMYYQKRIDESKFQQLTAKVNNLHSLIRNSRDSEHSTSGINNA